jgi:hypothetical protein
MIVVNESTLQTVNEPLVFDEFEALHLKVQIVASYNEKSFIKCGRWYPLARQIF